MQLRICSNEKLLAIKNAGGRAGGRKIWLRCNNWYLKTTKTDAAEGRERSEGMWMDTYEEYLQHLIGGKGGARDELLEYR